MQESQRHEASSDDIFSSVGTETSGSKADRLGTGVAIAILCIGLFAAGIWVLTRPSFEKCSVFGTVADRMACYEALRNELSRSPIR